MSSMHRHEAPGDRPMYVDKDKTRVPKMYRTLGRPNQNLARSALLCPDPHP
jgi:hypothetical protein